MNQLLTFDIIKLINSEKNDPQPPLNEANPFNQNHQKLNSHTNKFSKPHTGGSGTPIKDPLIIISQKKTPIKPSTYKEEYKEEEELIEKFPEESKEKNQNFEENSSVFQPMGKAAVLNKKNPWNIQDSKKSSGAKPKPVLNNGEDLKKNDVKVNKRLDLNALKKKGSYKKEPNIIKNSEAFKKNIEKDKTSDDKGAEDYYEKSSKFNTVTDPRIFAPENLALNKWSNEQLSDNGENIEENIKENESMRASKRQIKEKQISNFRSPKKKDIGTNFKINKGEISQEIITVEENMEEKPCESPNFRESAEVGTKSKGNYYEQELNKMINEDIRPYSPPFNNKTADFLKKGLEETGGTSQKNMLEVVYDAVLNCYYDPKTNSYYDLIK